MTADVVDMLKRQIVKADGQREQMRIDWPDSTAGIDKWRAEFGPGVKARFISEGGKTMGKPLPFDGTPVEQIIQLVDADAKRAAK